MFDVCCKACGVFHQFSLLRFGYASGCRPHPCVIHMDVQSVEGRKIGIFQIKLQFTALKSTHNRPIRVHPQRAAVWLVDLGDCVRRIRIEHRQPQLHCNVVDQSRR